MLSVGSRVEVRNDGCWIMDGDPDAYGVVTRNGKQMRAHRLVFETFNPRINIESMHIHHTCGRPGCVNPAHLEALTPSEHTLLHHAARRP
jgi:hypothetical protein